MFLGSENALINHLKGEKAFLERFTCAPVEGFSIHSPTRIKELFGLDITPFLNEALKTFKYHIFIPEIQSGYYYISDSNRYWRDDCLCHHIGRESRLNVLIHPFWWAEKTTPIIALIEQAMGGDLI
jgi:hypothetical protein